MPQQSKGKPQLSAVERRMVNDEGTLQYHTSTQPVAASNSTVDRKP